MEAKTIKISALNYKSICEYAGEFQKQIGEPISIDRALTLLLKKDKLSDLAGSWKMNDKEAEIFLKEVKKGWSKWKIKSA